MANKILALMGDRDAFNPRAVMTFPKDVVTFFECTGELSVGDVGVNLLVKFTVGVRFVVSLYEFSSRKLSVTDNCNFRIFSSVEVPLLDWVTATFIKLFRLIYNDEHGREPWLVCGMQRMISCIKKFGNCQTGVICNFTVAFKLYLVQFMNWFKFQKMLSSLCTFFILFLEHRVL